MPSDSKRIGKEILKELEIYPTRLGEALSKLNTLVRDCLERDAWNEVPVRCESAYELCDAMHGSEESREWSSAIHPAHAEGIFRAYEAISHLYQADRKLGEPEESAQLEKAIDCLEKSYGSFRLAGYLDWGNQHLIYEKLGKLSHLKVFSVIGQTVAGKEKLTLDDIIGHMRQTDEFEFEFEGQEVKAELLRGSKLKFFPEYDYVAMLVLEDSMDQAGISPYDCVILQEKKLVPLSPTSGDIVAVVFRDEDNRATLRRFYRDESSRSVRLEPESSNPKQKPRVSPLEVLEGDSPSVEVVGIAIAVLKLQSLPRGMLLPVIDEIAVGKERVVKEKPTLDDTIGPRASPIRTQIFLSYARQDEEKVEKLYQKLSNAGFKPWMDKKDILGGEKWELVIQKAIRRSEFFLACLSVNSVNKRGWIQKEIKDALDIYQQMLEHDIYLIPVRLEDCKVPESLCSFQWVNLFEEDGWTQLVKAIQVGMERRAAVPPEPVREQISDPHLDAHWKEVQRLVRNARWSEVIPLLKHIRKTSPWYKSEEVQTLLGKAREWQEKRR